MKTKLSLTCVFLSTISLAQWNIHPQKMTGTRGGLATAVKFEHIYFVGGYGNPTIDVFNSYADSIDTTYTMGKALHRSMAVAGDSAVYVFGGFKLPVGNFYANDELFVIKNGAISSQKLSEGLAYGSAAKAGSKIIFAGGMQSWQKFGISWYPVNSKTVVIYDELTGQITYDSLSQARSTMGVATDGQVVMFAGGLLNNNTPSNRIDIYDAGSGTWSIDSLAEPRAYVAGAYANGHFVFAGGCPGSFSSASQQVNIYDGKSWSLSSIPVGVCDMAAVSIGDNVVFLGGGVIDIYTTQASQSDMVFAFNTKYGTWVSTTLNTRRVYLSAETSRNRVYAIGGGNAVVGNHDTFEYWDFPLKLPGQSQIAEIGIYPNPAGDFARINSENEYDAIELRNLSGVLLLRMESDLDEIDLRNIEPGIYVVSILNSHQRLGMLKLSVR